MQQVARGTFEVRLTPVEEPGRAGGPGEAGQPSAINEPTGSDVPNGPDLSVETPPVATLAIDKTFHGDLEGTSVGRMLAVRTSVVDSAGYVAMERVTGTLAGRSGSFALQHSGTMDRGASTLGVTVVPDSGTEGLAGLKGSLEITVEDGRHEYVLRFELAQ